MRLIDFLLGGPKPTPQKVWKYIGKSELNLFEGTGSNKKDVPGYLLYYMTDDGERKFELHCNHPHAERHCQRYNGTYVNAQVWEKGGPFPKNFNAENDVLGDMLQRLIDQKITGEK